jgi:hypothetical protein
MPKKKKVEKDATLGDLLVFLQKRKFNLRSMEEVHRTNGDDGWIFVHGTSMNLVRDKEILAGIPKRKEWNAYGR